MSIFFHELYNFIYKVLPVLELMLILHPSPYQVIVITVVFMFCDVVG